MNLSLDTKFPFCCSGRLARCGTGYPGVGSRAHMHLAAVVGLDLPYGDVCGARDHGKPVSSAVEMLPVTDGCFPILLDAPGHGGKLNLNVLEKYTQRVLDVT